MDRRKIGKEHEDMAASYLVDSGYIILDRNYYWKHLEIDIIALDENTKDIVFVEVKYRKDDSFGGAEYAISQNKIKNLRLAALGFLRKNGYKTDSFIRFDCILITGNHINHVKNAW